ncbi:lipoprotein signal peptidase [Polaribacter glomeratus]|uniref:Lipoprotein signal peptidase n=1 Tax=Polaribacter glomeratus TaxID=102 RepID=A0A2S7WHC6_9FLAO|nr:lipoprotein signal peptidase [Polaribacter glomeratus]PQJ77014.1 lipoprotein signal peptidase [Polaribacter glomeratus]TXD67137.1 lipoprotein signal peptidase [Polaribacter glomeratus]
MSKKNLAILTILCTIILDQVIKIYIKTNFVLGEEVVVFDWFKIHFVENNGMAMGFEFGGKAGKLFLTVFRLFAVTAIMYWLIGTIKTKVHNAVIIAISLIFSGAIGNIIDSVFYGAIFDDSTNKVATLFADQPYGSIFHGKVVDMFYFPIWSGNLPSWIPFMGGETYTFFQYIFNPADAYITIGVALLFIFSKQAFPKEEKKIEA